MITFARILSNKMETKRLKEINTLRYSDIFLAMYSDNGSSCLHRNHSHVLVYMYSGQDSEAWHKLGPQVHQQVRERAVTAFTLFEL